MSYVFILWVVSSASQNLTPTEVRRVDVVPLYHTRTAACPRSRGIITCAACLYENIGGNTLINASQEKVS